MAPIVICGIIIIAISVSTIVVSYLDKKGFLD